MRGQGAISAGVLPCCEFKWKAVEVLKEILPKVKRVAFVWNPLNVAGARRFKKVQTAAQSLGLQIQSLEVRSPSELQGAVESATSERAGALLVPARMINPYRRQLVEFEAKNRLPTIYDDRESVEAGGLMSYGANRALLYRRGAVSKRRPR